MKEGECRRGSKRKRRRRGDSCTASKICCRLGSLAEAVLVVRGDEAGDLVVGGAISISLPSQVPGLAAFEPLARVSGVVVLRVVGG